MEKRALNKRYVKQKHKKPAKSIDLAGFFYLNRAVKIM